MRSAKNLFIKYFIYQIVVNQLFIKFNKKYFNNIKISIWEEKKTWNSISNENIIMRLSLFFRREKKYFYILFYIYFFLLIKDTLLKIRFV